MTWKATVRLSFVLIVLCLPTASGCTVCKNLRRTVCQEPSIFSWKKDKRRSEDLYREWAIAAWQQECSGLGLSPGPEYRAGFLDGFTDFVFAGGTGEPPPIPPRRYWNAALRSPAGKELAEEWFAGYRHGARVAHEGGYRDSVTIATSFSTEIPDQLDIGPVLHSEEIDAEVLTPWLELPTPKLKPEPDVNGTPLKTAPTDGARNEIRESASNRLEVSKVVLAMAEHPSPITADHDSRTATIGTPRRLLPQGVTQAATRGVAATNATGSAEIPPDQSTLRMVPAGSDSSVTSPGNSGSRRRMSSAVEFTR